MNSKLQTCPKPESLANFMLGKLPSEEVESYEVHLAHCTPCNETIRALDVHDTLTELTQDVFGACESNQSLPVDIDDQTAVQDLVHQMKQLGSPVVSSRSGDLDGPTPLESRAAEVQKLFAPSNDTTAIGQLAHFRIEQLLGAGSTGVVYLASDQNLNRKVALKILRPSLGRAARDRFVAEARATAAINAPNVVTIYHVGTVGSLAYIAMQWTPGETLEQRLCREKLLTADQVQKIGKQVANGLAAAHQIGLIHRDIKPANIWMESKTDNIKILDFGLVRATDEELQLTYTGMIAGTPSYMSPEQSRGAKLDCRSDFFSLGCVLYESLTGQMPFRGDNMLSTLQAIQLDRPDVPRKLNASIPEDLSALVMCLLEKSAMNRPPTAESIAEAVVRPRSDWSFDPEPAAVKPQTKAGDHFKGPSIRGKHWLYWLIGLSASLLLVSAGIFGLPQIIRIATNQGELVINSSDADIKIEILNGGDVVNIVDLKTQQSINLRAGEYDIRPVSDANSISIDRNTIVLSRGSQEVVRVTRTSNSNSSMQGDPRREAFNQLLADQPPSINHRYSLWAEREALLGQYQLNHPKVVEIDAKLKAIGQDPGTHQAPDSMDLLNRGSKRVFANEPQPNYSEDLIKQFGQQRIRLAELSSAITQHRHSLYHKVWANDPFLNGLTQFESVAKSKTRWYDSVLAVGPPEDLPSEVSWLSDFNHRLEERVAAAKERLSRIEKLAETFSNLSGMFSPGHNEVVSTTEKLNQLGYRFEKPNDSQHSSIFLSEIIGRTSDEDEIRRAIAQFRIAENNARAEWVDAQGRYLNTHPKVQKLKQKLDEFSLQVESSSLQLQQYQLTNKIDRQAASSPQQATNNQHENQNQATSLDETVADGESRDDYLLGSGDVLGVFVEAVLDQGNIMPPVHLAEEGTGMLTASGFPVLVDSDRTISLPLIKPISVGGKNVRQVLELVKKAYVEGEDPILKPSARISVTLLKKRPRLDLKK